MGPFSRTVGYLGLALLLSCSEEGTGSAAGGAGEATSSGGAGGVGGAAISGGSLPVGGAAGATTGGGESSGGGTGGAGGSAPPEDACFDATPTCDVPPPTASGQGLVPLDRCAFALDRGASFATYPDRIEALAALAEPVTLADVLGDLNRTPVVTASAPGDPPGLEFAFRWEDAENNKPTWVPQGITGSPDADPSGLVLGRKLWLVSFYFKEDEAPKAAPKGVRLALVDMTNPAAPRYRFLLLVEPLEGANFTHVPLHAGGMAWVGNYLYVASTTSGFRVFDMQKVLRVDTSADVIGCNGTLCQAGLHKYALPQVGTYGRSSVCAEEPRFSFVGLDRSSSPIALVSGEYCSGTSCSGALAGRLFQWPLNEATGLLAGPSRTYSSGAYFAGERQMQGAVSHEGTFFISSSEPAGAAGALYAVTGNGRTAHGWIDAPEDVMIDRSNVSSPKIVSLSEGLGERYVFQADLGAYLP